ncbi:unnamed protein product [Sphenostylis stenocarpa]|uniref:F-box associated domain-containing protein n=1 Tax=Sphenostylis stenocarpa TaxID=92480 RepID=A0AA86RU20_9FABA|nr:unnamed protein product [Sphenostylis stenocarpa]
MALDRDDAHHHDLIIAFGELAIVSLDLRTETSTQFLLPQVLDTVYMLDSSHVGFEWGYHDSLVVLKDCLALFFHNHTKRIISIWQMKKFGDRKSWTFSLNINMQDLQLHCMPCPYLQPLIMLENKVLILDSTHKKIRIVTFDGRGNVLEHHHISTDLYRIFPTSYVQTLVSPISH